MVGTAGNATGAGPSGKADDVKGELDVPLAARKKKKARAPPPPATGVLLKAGLPEIDPFSTLTVAALKLELQKLGKPVSGNTSSCSFVQVVCRRLSIACCQLPISTRAFVSFESASASSQMHLPCMPAVFTRCTRE